MTAIKYIVKQIKNLFITKQEDESSPILYHDFEELKEKKDRIEKVLSRLGFGMGRIDIKPGRIVSNFEVIPSKEAKPSKLRNLNQEIINDLKLPGTRIINPTPGRGSITFEIPNDNRTIYSIKKGLKSNELIESNYNLPCLLGMDDNPMIVDLTKIPHLIASGAYSEDVIHTALLSMMSTKSPNDLKVILIDTTKIEFSHYMPLAEPYLVKLENEDETIITDVNKAVMAIKALNGLMEKRYDMLRDAIATNIKHYNKLVAKGILSAENGHEYMPYYVVAIADYGDLMQTAGKAFELEIARLAQLSRAVGIHVIMSTYCFDNNVQTGFIKANFPGRVAAMSHNEYRSRLIIDVSGAEYLLDTNDYLVNVGNGIKRITSYSLDSLYDVPLIVEDILSKLNLECEQTYLPVVDKATDNIEDCNSDILPEPSIEEVAELIWQEKSASVSFIQRTCGLGYNQAGKIMEKLECAGIVGPLIDESPREILVSSIDELHLILSSGTHQNHLKSDETKQRR